MKGFDFMKPVIWHLRHQNQHTWTLIRDNGHLIQVNPETHPELLTELVGAIDKISVEDWNRWHMKNRAPEYIIRDGKKIKVDFVVIMEVEKGWTMESNS